jgi:hypothetical protein
VSLLLQLLQLQDRSNGITSSGVQEQHCIAEMLLLLRCVLLLLNTVPRRAPR